MSPYGIVEIEFHERCLKEIIHQVASQTLSPQQAASMIVRKFEKRAEGPSARCRRFLG